MGRLRDRIKRAILIVRTNMYSPDQPRGWNPDDPSLSRAFGIPHEPAAVLRCSRTGKFPYVALGWTKTRFLHEVSQAATKEQEARAAGRHIHSERVPFETARTYLEEDLTTNGESQ